MFKISGRSICNDKNSNSGSTSTQDKSPAKNPMDESEKDPNKSREHKPAQKQIKFSESQRNAQQNVKVEEKVVKPLRRISKWLA